MKTLWNALAVASLAVAVASPALAQNSVNFPTIGEIVREDAAIDKLIAKGTPIQVLSSGFDWSEGPVWVPAVGAEPGHLLFSDVPRNTILKWVEGEGSSVFLKPSGYTGQVDYGGEPGSNGLMLSPEGLLCACEHGDRRVSILTKDGGKRTLVDNYEGQRFNSPNDLVFKSNGDLYFTDPPYGLPKQADDPRRELDFCGVYRLAKNGKLTLLTKEMTRPNGLAFSPDEKTLYVAQSDPAAPIWKSFPVKEDGTLGESKVFYDATKEFKQGLPGLPDGMDVDSHGNLFATGPGGVLIFNPSGKLLGRISTGQNTANCKFGGPQGDQLYITADMYLCRVCDAHALAGG